MPKVIRAEQSIYECLLGFCFNNTFSAYTNFGCIDSFFCPIPKQKSVGDGFLLVLPVCFEQ